MEPTSDQTRPHPSRSAQWIAPLAALAVAVVARAALGSGFVSLDPMFSLAWGRQLASGQLPTYSPGPTPHPLSNAVAAVLSLGGPLLAVDGMLLLSFLSYGVLVVATWSVARGFTGTVGATVAAGLIGTNLLTVSSTLRAYLDIPYAALLMTAVAVEARRPCSLLPVLGLLGAAGLLRPEAWFVAGFYWLWSFRRPPRDGAVRAAAVVALAPAIWLLSELVITGDPLFSLKGTKESAQAVAVYGSGFSALVTDGPRTLLASLGRPTALVGVIGLAVLAVRRPRSARWLVGVTAGIALSAAIPVAAGTLLNPRYVITVLALLCVAAGVAVGDWRPAGRRGDRATAVVAVLCALLLLSAGMGRAREVRSSAESAQRTARSYEAVRQLLRGPVPCPPVVVPNGRLLPFISVWRDVPMSSVVVASPTGPRHGTFVFGTPDAMAGTVTNARRDVGKSLPRPPADATQVRERQGWTLSAAC